MRLKPPNPPPGDNQRSWDQWCRSMDVTFTNGEVPSAAIVDNAATNAKLADMPALSVKARSANSTGDPVDLQASANGQYLQRSGDLLVWSGLALADITAGHVTQHMQAIRSFLPRPATPVDEFALLMASRVFARR